MEKLEKINFLTNHIKTTNPHTGSRNAFMGIGGDLLRYDWNVEAQFIQPDDTRIDFDNLYTASKRDVKKYMKYYNKGHEFPAIILGIKQRTNGKLIFSVLDGAHRLKAAINLNVPIQAFIGEER